VNPKAKIILFSAMNDPDVKQRSVEVGAAAFVCKGPGDLSRPSNGCVPTEVDPPRWVTDASTINQKRVTPLMFRSTTHIPKAIVAT
jgi:hypothetical protein